MIVDVLDSFLNWDSKFIHTIGLLITRPWRLTNEFLAGHRVRYLHPARLYLLTSIVFFFAVTYGFKSIKIDPIQLFHRSSGRGQKRTGTRECARRRKLPRWTELLERGFFSPKKRSEIEEQLKREDLTDKERANLEEKLKIGNEVAANIEEAMKDLGPEIQAKVDRAIKEAAKNKPKTAFEVDY